MGRAGTFAIILVLTILLAAGGLLLVGLAHAHAVAQQERDRARLAQEQVAETRAFHHPECWHIPVGRLPGVAVRAPIAPHLTEAVKQAQARFSLVEFYVRFGKPFPLQQAIQISAAGAVPVIQLNPSGISLNQIDAGGYDSYLRAYAAAASKFRCRVVLSFGHEMNGTWYSWGCTHTKAAVFIAAWQHVVTLMRTARNITWMWTTNTQNGPCTIQSRWPGAKYVDWVGVDGYIRKPAETFNALFNATLAAVRHLAPSKTVIIAETGAIQGPSQQRVLRTIYRGAAHHNLRAVIYFDMTGKLGNYQPTTLEGFRAGIKYYTRKGAK